MGIAQRQVQVSRAHIPTDRYRSKPLPDSIQTIGDAIHIKRREMGLSRWQFALRMGIATLTARAWELGLSHPNEQQVKLAEKILGFKAEAVLPKSPR